MGLPTQTARSPFPLEALSGRGVLHVLLTVGLVFVARYSYLVCVQDPTAAQILSETLQLSPLKWTCFHSAASGARRVSPPKREVCRKAADLLLDPRRPGLQLEGSR